MQNLKFKYIHNGPYGYLKHVNNKKKIENEQKILKLLKRYLNEILGSNAYVLVKVSEDGETFHNEILGLRTNAKIIEINQLLIMYD